MKSLLGITDLFQWKDINPDQLMDFKLKCVFENPVSSNTAPSSDGPDDDKNKGIGDSVKSSPKVTFEPLSTFLIIIHRC